MPPKTAPAKTQPAKKGKAPTKKQTKAPAKAKTPHKRHFILYAEGVSTQFAYRSLEGVDRHARTLYTPGPDDKDNMRPVSAVIYGVKEENNVYIVEPPKKVSSRMAECSVCACVPRTPALLLLLPPSLYPPTHPHGAISMGESFLHASFTHTHAHTHPFFRCTCFLVSKLSMVDISSSASTAANKKPPGP